jgi:hypothetical protein
MENNGMYIETKMMLPVKTITEHAHNLYQMSSNLRSIAYDLHYFPGSKGNTAYATCNYVKTLVFFFIKNEYYFVSNLFKIYLA